MVVDIRDIIQRWRKNQVREFVKNLSRFAKHFLSFALSMVSDIIETKRHFLLPCHSSFESR